MVGRILAALQAQGVLREPVRGTVARGKRRPERPYAVRKPASYTVTQDDIDNGFVDDDIDNTATANAPTAKSTATLASA